jgi:hypothetical protein
VSDPSFEAIIAERIAIDKYLAFRFRSFIVITAAMRRSITARSTFRSSVDATPE